MKEKKVVSLCLAIALTSSAFVGCGRDLDNSDFRPVDDSKSQIAVANLYGGLGDAWLRKVADQFEEKHAETPFEEGKKGVQVHINNYAPTAMAGGSILSKIEFSSDAIYLGEQISPKDFAASGKVLDITDLISTPLTEYGESESILDKLDDYLVENIKTNEDKYYVLPFYEAFYQMYYDADLFDYNGFYFKEGASADGLDVLNLDVAIDHLFVLDATDTKSVGPDLQAGTTDDGLPVTYNDFLALARYMAIDSATGVVPVVWTGQYVGYMLSYCVSLWANEEGYEDMMKLLSLSGQLDELIDVADNGVVTELDPVELNTDNGYMFQKQSSRYEVLKFLEKFIKTSYHYDPKSLGSGYSHLGAQDQFLYSRNLSNVDDIGILIEGSWWNHEASATFNTMAAESGEEWSRQNRRIGVLPPFRSDRTQSETTLVALNDSYCCLNGNLKGAQKTIAEQFFRYLHTDQALSTFTSIVGMTRAFDYEVDEDTYESMPYYAKCMYDLKKNSRVIYPESQVSKIYNNESFFDFNSFGFTMEWKGATYTNPFVVFNNQKEVTAETYFKGIYTSTQKRWATLG